MARPPELFWVDMKLSGNPIPYHRNTAGVRGGKRSSLRAAKESREQILRADPAATVTIYRTGTDWIEVPNSKGAPNDQQ
jgi:hypothetical protein